MQVRDQMTEAVQYAAGTKTALLVGIGGATATSWIDWLVYSPEAKAIGIVLGALVSMSIVLINVTSVKYKRATALAEIEAIKQERLLNEKRSILIDEQLKKLKCDKEDK